MMTHVTFRPATVGDARAIAALFQVSSDGVADYVWSLLREEYPGLSLIEIGERRYARKNTAFSYENCIVAEQDGSVVGMLHSFPMSEPEPAGSDDADDIDPVLRPYTELEIPGSLYISGLALLPDFRNRGVGSDFLRIAEQRARELSLGSLSLLVFDANDGAARLYERHGYSEVDRRAIVPHPLIHFTGDVVLLEKTLSRCRAEKLAG